MRNLLLLIGIFGGFSVSYAQWREDFETDLSEWRGDVERFRLENGYLRSDGEEKASTLDIYYLLDLRRTLDEDLGFSKGCSWEGKVVLDFNPSSANFIRIYLSAVSENREKDSCLYLQLGEVGGKNRWRLYYSKAGEAMEILCSPQIFSAAEGVCCKFRLDFYPQGRWVLYVKKMSYKDQDQDSGWDKEFAEATTPFLSLESGLFETVYTGVRTVYQNPSRRDKFGVDYLSCSSVHPLDTLHDPGERETERDTLRAEAGQLQWSEILFDAGVGYTKYVEFYNSASDSVSLRNLALGIEKNSKVKWYYLNKDSTLRMPPSSYLYFTNEEDELHPQYRSCTGNRIRIRGFPSLSTTSGHLLVAYLTDRDTVLLDSMYYHKDFHFWNIANTENVSLERLSFRISGEVGENWHSAAESSGWGTPGCRNSQTMTSAEEENVSAFEFSDRVITPNNDGVTDVLKISWNLNDPGYVANLYFFDEWGRKCRTLWVERNIGSRGEEVFDGCDQSGLPLRPGLYVCMIELFHAERRIRRLRYPLGVR